MADIKLRITAANAFYYPDVMLTYDLSDPIQKNILHISRVAQPLILDRRAVDYFIRDERREWQQGRLALDDIYEYDDFTRQVTRSAPATSHLYSSRSISHGYPDHAYKQASNEPQG